MNMSSSSAAGADGYTTVHGATLHTTGQLMQGVPKVFTRIAICRMCSSREAVAEALSESTKRHASAGGRPSKRSQESTFQKLSNKSGAPREHVRGVLQALAECAAEAVATTGTFAIPGLLTLSRKSLPQRGAHTKTINGKTVQCKAKPRRHKLAVTFHKPLKVATGVD